MINHGLPSRNGEGGFLKLEFPEMRKGCLKERGELKSFYASVLKFGKYTERNDAYVDIKLVSLWS